MIIETDNNILTSLPDHSVVIHPVNCFGELQPGLGQAINRKYPNWYKDYKGYCSWFLKSEWSDKSHTDEILGTFHRHQPDDNTIICSVFVQERFGRRGYAPDLDLWDRALNRIELQTRRVQRVTGQKWTLHMLHSICFDDTIIDGEQLIDIVKQHFGNSPVEIYLHRR